MKKFILLLASLVLLTALAGFIKFNFLDTPMVGPPQIWTADNGESVETRTYSGGVFEVILPDGSSSKLKRVMSASGEKYANANEKFVFWSKSNSFFIEENGKITVRGTLTDSNVDVVSPNQISQNDLPPFELILSNIQNTDFSADIVLSDCKIISQGKLLVTFDCTAKINEVFATKIPDIGHSFRYIKTLEATHKQANLEAQNNQRLLISIDQKTDETGRVYYIDPDVAFSFAYSEALAEYFHTAK